MVRHKCLHLGVHFLVRCFQSQPKQQYNARKWQPSRSKLFYGTCQDVTSASEVDVESYASLNGFNRHPLKATQTERPPSQCSMRDLLVTETLVSTTCPESLFTWQRNGRVSIRKSAIITKTLSCHNLHNWTSITCHRQWTNARHISTSMQTHIHESEWQICLVQSVVYRRRQTPVQFLSV